MKGASRGPGLPMQALSRVRRYLLHELWHGGLAERPFGSLPRRALQLLVMIGEGFFRERLLLRASALTYMAILSVIPLLVVALSIVKAVGISENLAELAVDQLAAGSPEAKVRILDLVENANLAGLGTLGAALLLVTSVLALRHAEITLNEIWGVLRGRSWMRRFADYLAVLVVAPLFTGVALSLAATLESDPLVGALRESPAFERLFSTGLQYAPTGLLFIGFTFIYWFLPNTRVRVGSALFGGGLAALLFTAAQHLYLDFSVGAAKYNALFGGFAALPLLLVWLYLSFAIFLLGAEFSFAHQNLAQYRRELRGTALGLAEREAIGIRIAIEVARAFRDRADPWTADSLSEAFSLPLRAVGELLEQLEQGGIVASRAGQERETAFQLGAPAEDLSIADVLAALRGSRGRVQTADEGAVDSGAGPAAAALLDELDGAVSRVAVERSLADVLRSVPSPA